MKYEMKVFFIITLIMIIIYADKALSLLLR